MYTNSKYTNAHGEELVIFENYGNHEQIAKLNQSTRIHVIDAKYDSSFGVLEIKDQECMGAADLFGE